MSNAAKYPFLAPPENPDELGRMGIYRVLKLLGEGGMGQVFLALDPRLERQVALKVLARRGATGTTAQDRFLREARSMAAIKHDNVAMIYDVGEHDTTPFMAMELLVGKELDALLKTDIEFTPLQVTSLGRGLARGLAAAHAQGIIHRDVKPGNIWIETSGRPKLLDFGLAKPLGPADSLSQRGAVAGTPGYLSPEQARDDPVDDRVDVYGLGVVLFELLTKSLPFKGNSIAELLLAILTEPTPNVIDINPNVPEPLADLVARLLAKEPHDRPRSAVEAERLLQQVAEVLSGNNVATQKIEIAFEQSTTSISSSRIAQAKFKRKKWLIPGISAGVGLILFGFVGWWLTALDKPPPEFIAPVQEQRALPISASDLSPLRIGEFSPQQKEFLEGENATFLFNLKNTADSPRNDPKTKLGASAKTACQFTVQLRLLPDGVSELASMLPLRLSPKQLPIASSSKSLQIKFETKGLKLGKYSVQLLLETPGGIQAGSALSEFLLSRNFQNVPLPKPLRVYMGRGADTVVQLGLDQDFGAEKVLLIGSDGGKDSPPSKTYLRFDLSGIKAEKGGFSYAVLAFTLAKDSPADVRSILVWGVLEGRDGGIWAEQGEGHINWKTAPGTDDPAVSRILGTLKIDNTGNTLNEKVDQVRFASPELDDLVRSDTDGLLTLYLAAKENSHPPVKILSKEADPDQSPSLTLLTN